jgi:hypothetical protein
MDLNSYYFDDIVRHGKTFIKVENVGAPDAPLRSFVALMLPNLL